MTTKPRTLILLGSALTLAVTATWAFSMPSASDVEGTPTSTSGPRPVSVLTIDSSALVTPLVSAVGEALAQYSVTLSAEVEGEILSVSEDAFSGGLLQAGDSILQIENSRQERALSAAEANAAMASSRLAEEELRAEQAADEWNRAGATAPPSEYVLRRPQLRAARSSLANARAAVSEATQRMDDASVPAPFNAVVVRRLVSPGDYVQPGTSLVELYGSDRIEVRLPLTAMQWNLLPPEDDLVGGDTSVSLVGVAEGDRWEGVVLRVEKHVEAVTRQRALVVGVDSPLALDPPLFPGTFVEATIVGRSRADLLEIPPSAYTDRGEVWFIDEEGLLARTPVDPLLSGDGRLLIRRFSDAPTLQVLTHPMLSYAPGMKVLSTEATP